MTIVRLDRVLAARTALMALLLLWPLLVFGQPAYFADSLSYYKGGRAAVAFVADKIAPVAAPAASNVAPPAGASSVVAEAEQAKGARSILYSVAAYVLRAPGADMALLAVAQALATALTIAVAAGLAGVQRHRAFALIAIVIAGATPAAYFANLIIPDIFAGMLILALAMIATAGERLSRALRVVLVLIASFAVTSHASHIPLAGGLSVLGLAWLVFGGGAQRRLIPWLLAPLVLGVVATVATGFVGFGTVSLAAKRFPLALARSVEDGPARWYLEKNCATKHYAVCEVFGDKIPETVPTFLWAPDGLDGRATLDQMNRIREEEQEILVEAAKAYPGEQSSATLHNIALQTVYFGLNEARFDERIELDDTGAPYLVPTGADHEGLATIVEWLSILSAFGGILWLGWRFRRLAREEQAMVVLVLCGLLGNAVICAVFSGVAERYQARVIWLVPLLALSFALRPRQARS